MIFGPIGYTSSLVPMVQIIFRGPGCTGLFHRRLGQVIHNLWTSNCSPPHSWEEGGYVAVLLFGPVETTVDK